MKKTVLTRPQIFVPVLLTAATLISACASDGGGLSEAAPGQAMPGADAVNADQIEIVRGVPDRGRDPAVVAIDIGQTALCTGALIAPDVVLTAHHCVARTVEQIECPASQPQIGAQRSAASMQILVGDEAGLATVAAYGKEIVAPKGWALCDADLALIVLDRAIEGIAPLGVRQTGVAVGDHIRVGFGRAGDGQPAGVKLLREHVRVTQATDTEFVVGEATCQGDSGGPALDEETGLIVGVVSRGGPTCDGKNVHNIYTRTDTYLSLIMEAFRRSGHPDPDPAPSAIPLDAGTTVSPADAAKPKKDAGPPKRKKPASDMGGACTSASDCSAGVCVSEHSKKYCSRPCDTHDRCPAHFNCKMATSGSKVCVETRSPRSVERPRIANLRQ